MGKTVVSSLDVVLIYVRTSTPLSFEAISKLQTGIIGEVAECQLPTASISSALPAASTKDVSNKAGSELSHLLYIGLSFLYYKSSLVLNHGSIKSDLFRIVLIIDFQIVSSIDSSAQAATSLLTSLSVSAEVLTDSESLAFKNSMKRWSDSSISAPSAILLPTTESDILKIVRPSISHDIYPLLIPTARLNMLLQPKSPLLPNQAATVHGPELPPQAG